MYWPASTYSNYASTRCTPNQRHVFLRYFWRNDISAFIFRRLCRFKTCELCWRRLDGSFKKPRELWSNEISVLTLHTSPPARYLPPVSRSMQSTISRLMGHANDRPDGWDRLSAEVKHRPINSHSDSAVSRRDATELPITVNNVIVGWHERRYVIRWCWLAASKISWKGWTEW